MPAGKNRVVVGRIVDMGLGGCQLKPQACEKKEQVHDGSFMELSKFTAEERGRISDIKLSSLAG